jgi:hypothetical protein
MFVERNVHYSALFTYLVGWHASALSFPLSDVILTQLACPLIDIMFCLHSGITLYKHCYRTNLYQWKHGFSVALSKCAKASKAGIFANKLRKCVRDFSLQIAKNKMQNWAQKFENCKQWLDYAKLPIFKFYLMVEFLIFVLSENKSGII